MLDKKAILELCKEGMITPYLTESTRVHHTSTGPTYTGYDITLGSCWKIPLPSGVPFELGVTRPEMFFRTLNESSFVLRPSQSVLAVSKERFHIPTHITATCVGKSTHARHGIFVNVTPLEPGWEGYLTLEITNLHPYPYVLKEGMGIAQLQFHLTNNTEAYQGKYQNQTNQPVYATGYKED